MSQLMPLPLTVSCSSKIQIGFTFLVPAYPGCPGKEAVKWLYTAVPIKRNVDVQCICHGVNDFRIHEKLVVHCQDAKAAIFEKLCENFLHCTAFESMEQTHVSNIVIC